MPDRADSPGAEPTGASMVEPTGAPATEPTGPPGAEPTGAAGAGPGAPLDPGRVAIGTWSGGRFMHFGEPLDDERLQALITPDESISHDPHRRRLRDRRGRRDARARHRRPPPRSDVHRRRRRTRLLRGRAQRPQGLPALHRSGPARPRRLRRLSAGWPPSAASSAAGSTASTCCCCTTPTGSATPARSSGTAMAGLREPV